MKDPEDQELPSWLPQRHVRDAARMHGTRLCRWILDRCATGPEAPKNGPSKKEATAAPDRCDSMSDRDTPGAGKHLLEWRLHQPYEKRRATSSKQSVCDHVVPSSIATPRLEAELHGRRRSIATTG